MKEQRSNPVRYQLYQMDHAIRMLPVGFTAATPAILCQPFGETYVLASDHDAEIERLTRELEESRAANWRLLGTLGAPDETDV